MSAQAEEQADRPLRGIATLVLGVSVFMMQDVIIKLLSGGHPVHEMLFFRCVTGLPLILILIRFTGTRNDLRLQPLAVLRGRLHIVSFTLYYLALATLPLAEAATLYYAAPLMITALSAPFLKKQVGIRRWLAVFVGFIGVVIVLRPDAAVDSAMLFALGSAFFFSLSMMINRAAGKRISSASFALHSMAVLLIISTAIGLIAGDGRFDEGSDPALSFLLWARVMPQGWNLVMLAEIGPISAVGSLLLAEAYRVAPASLVTPFEYGSLPLAVLAGFVFFGDLPALNTWIGLVFIIGSGLYILHREQVRQHAVNRGSPPLRPRL